MSSSKIIKILIIFAGLFLGKLFSHYYITGVHYDKYSSISGGYSVTMPQKYQKSEEKIPSQWGNIKVFIVESADRNNMIKYGCSHCDYPSQFVFSVKPSDLLNSVIEGQLKDPQNLKIINKNDFNYKNYPGLDVVMESKNDSITRVKIVLVKNRLYQLITNCKRKESRNKRIEEFFNSLEISG